LERKASVTTSDQKIMKYSLNITHWFCD